MAYKCDWSPKEECDGCMTCIASREEYFKDCDDCMNEFSSYVLTDTEKGHLCPTCLGTYEEGGVRNGRYANY